MGTDLTTETIPSEPSLDFHALNAMLNLYDANGKIQFDKDREAVRQYFLQHVNQNMVFHHTLHERINYLVDNDYYDRDLIESYPFEFIKALTKSVYDKKFRFHTFMGAFKFYTSYALKTFDGKRYLERFEDRIVMTALLLARGDQKLARDLAAEMISGRFQPATPTFLNAGKAQRGELVSCFPGSTPVDTDKGRVRIDTVRPSDRILSHDGKYHAVTGVTERPYSGEMVSLSITGAASPIVSTPEHPFLVHRRSGATSIEQLAGRDGQTTNTAWVAARDIQPGDMVIAAHPQETNDLRDYNLIDFVDDRSAFEESDGFLYKLNRDPKTIKKHGRYSRGASPIRSRVAVDARLGRFLGYYIAEGYVMVQQTKSGIAGPKGINFTFGTNELGYIADVTELSASLFGLSAKTKTNRDGSTNVYVNSKVLAEFALGVVGSGFGRKILPQSLIEATRGFQRELLIGAYRGDGCTIGSAVTMSLTNPPLVQQLKFLALRNKLLARTRDYESASGKIAGQLDITGYPGAEEDFILDVGKNLHKFVGASVHEPVPSEWVDGYPAYRVRFVSTELASEVVYNLEVEDTHTYSVQGFVVHNCFLLRVEDSMESIGRGINSSLQLSKRGGGVALLLSNLREHGAPIKKIENQASGVIPVMKLLEDSFSYANQLGARQGAGAVYLHAHHPDIMRFLDTKRENADEKIRIKTLSLGVVIPDITFELAKRNEDMYLFSPYDVERVYGVPFSDISVTEKYAEMVADSRITKTKINARKFFETLAELQFESGYPYIMFEDNVNRANLVKGRINMSNLCSEILQVNTPSKLNEDLTYDRVGRDISCNLGSLNIALTMDGGNLGKTVEIAIRGLSAVSDLSDIRSVPSVASGNRLSHAIGLGQMNLHGYLAREKVHYDSPTAVDFTNIYFYTVLFYALRASNRLAHDKQEVFAGFEDSKYATGEFFDKYIDQAWVPKTAKVRGLFAKAGVTVPSQEDWRRLRAAVGKYGIYNQNLQAVPPTGSISYINNSTASIHPIIDKIETRKEGKIGRVYVPAPFLTNDNVEFYRDAYDIGPQAIIDVYAAATQHVDQGLSLTLFFKDSATTRDVNRAQVAAFKAGIKTTYYVRVRKLALPGTEMQECVSCSL